MDGSGSGVATERGKRFRSPAPVLRHPRLTLGTALVAVFLAVLPRLDLLGGGWIPVLQALVPVICLGAALVSVFMLLGRRWVPALLLLAGAVLGMLPALVLGGNPQVSSAVPITVFSVNVEHSQADPGALAETIKVHHVEVVILVEVDEPLIGNLLAHGVKGLLPYRSPTVTPGDTAGTVILSKYPLHQESRIPVVDGLVAFDQPTAIIRHPQLGPIRVAAVHPLAPVVDGAVQWRRTLGSIRVWQALHTEVPLVLAGDFNASYAHPAFRELARDLTDTATAAGIVPLPTWPANGRIPAFTAIDHVLTRGLSATSWQRVSIPNTDHYGILATVTGVEP